MNLSEFVLEVRQRVRAVADDPRFEPDQQRLLKATIRGFERHAEPSEFAQPLGLLYLVMRAWGRSPDETAVRIGAFCMLYLCAGDLIDDVQDDDLYGKPHELAGPAIAINSALALMFAGLEVLREAMQSEPDPAKRVAFLAALNRVSLLGVGRQHVDLLSTTSSLSPDEVLHRDKGKSSSVSLFMECGALLADLDPHLVQTYREVGERLAGMVQIVDDLRDIYGKDVSPDLRGTKATYPSACFEQLADPELKSRYEALRQSLPHSIGEIRDLFHNAGVVDACACTIDELRLEMHHAIAATRNCSSAHRLLLEVIDAVAQSVYSVEPSPQTSSLDFFATGFDDAVREEVRVFYERTGVETPPPQLRAWHHPHFLYVPSRQTLFYPDVDGLPEEVLPFHQALFGLDQRQCSEFLRMQLPLCIAHELAHHLRCAAGVLGDHVWREELIADRLAVAYGQKFAANASRQLLRALERPLNAMTPEQGRRVDRLINSVDSDDERDAGADMTVAALAHLELHRRFAQRQLDLLTEVTRLTLPDAHLDDSAASGAGRLVA